MSWTPCMHGQVFPKRKEGPHNTQPRKHSSSFSSPLPLDQDAVRRLLCASSRGGGGPEARHTTHSRRRSVEPRYPKGKTCPDETRAVTQCAWPQLHACHHQPPGSSAFLSTLLHLHTTDPDRVESTILLPTVVQPASFSNSRAWTYWCRSNHGTRHPDSLSTCRSVTAPFRQLKYDRAKTGEQVGGCEAVGGASRVGDAEFTPLVDFGLSAHVASSPVALKHSLCLGFEQPVVLTLWEMGVFDFCYVQ